MNWLSHHLFTVDIAGSNPVRSPNFGVTMYGNEQSIITLTHTKKHSQMQDFDSRVTYQIKNGDCLTDVFEHFKNFCTAMGFHSDAVDQMVMLEDNEEVIEKDEEENEEYEGV